MSKEQQSPNETKQITPDDLLNAPRRWHLALPLRVAEGFAERFQPTGFPNLGPALYKAASGDTTADYLLVESAQSLANWMEALCLDPGNPCRYNSECTNIPYVVVQEKVNEQEQDLTSSLTEPHRLASDEILEKAAYHGIRFKEILENTLGVNKQRPVHLPKIAKRLFYIDPACLLHGVFLEKLDGRIRFPRLLSATITAKYPQPVNSGGVMRGYVTISGSESSIPYSSQHFTSPEIMLHLTFHTDSLKMLGLDAEERNFLATFAFYKISKLIESFPRLRTACVLDVSGFSPAKADLKAVIDKAFTEERRKEVFGLKDKSVPSAQDLGEAENRLKKAEQENENADTQKKSDAKKKVEASKKDLVDMLTLSIALGTEKPSVLLKQ
jgi:CRISPR-associated protein Csb1